MDPDPMRTYFLIDHDRLEKLRNMLVEMGYEIISVQTSEDHLCRIAPRIQIKLNQLKSPY